METVFVFEKPIIGSGTAKRAYNIDNESVVLYPKTNTANNDKKITMEYEMLRYLQSLGFPIIEDTMIVNADGPLGRRLALRQRYIKNSILYKPFSISPMTLSPANIMTLQSIYDNLVIKKVYISDLQILANDQELYIIDPSNIYCLESHYYIGNHPKIKSHQEYFVAYINQIRKLKNILDFNSNGGSLSP
jgi:hypothetical protein